MAKPDLKPCPFCGASDPSDVYVDRLQSDGRRWAVLCTATDCLVEGPHRATKREAIAAWNTRDDAEVQRLVAEARAEAFEEAARAAEMVRDADYKAEASGDFDHMGGASACISEIRALSDAPPRQVTPQEAAKVLLGAIPNPAFDTLKPILMGEHSVNLPDFDEDGQEYVRKVNVPWDVQKRIIADALRALANGGAD